MATLTPEQKSQMAAAYKAAKAGGATAQQAFQQVAPQQTAPAAVPSPVNVNPTISQANVPDKKQIIADYQQAKSSGMSAQDAFQKVQPQTTAYQEQQKAVPTVPKTETPKTTTGGASSTSTYATKAGVSSNQMAGDKFSFQKDVQAMGAGAKDYMEGRNNTIAQTAVDKMNQLAQQGQKLDNLTKDKILQETIASMGGQVDFNNPDRQRTMQAINEKITQNVGGNLDSFYSKSSSEYNNLQKYMGTSTDSLVSQITKGELTLENIKNLSSVDPQKYKEILAGVNKQKEISGMKSDIAVQENLYGTAEEGTIVKREETIQEKMTKMMEAMYSMTINSSVSGKAAVEEYRKAINSPELLKMSDELSSKVKEIKDIDETISGIKDEVVKQYPGLTKSQVNSIINDRVEDLQKTRRTLQLDAEELQSNITNRTNTAQQEYKLALEERQMQQQDNNQKMQFLNMQYNIMKDTQDREDKFAMIDLQADKEREMYTKKMDAQREQTKKEAKFQEVMEKGDITSKDQNERRKAIGYSVDETLKEFEGLPMVRSRDQMVDDISSGLASGKYKTLGQAVTENIRKPIQTKSEYKLRAAKRAGIDITPSFSKINDTTVGYFDANGNFTYKSIGQTTGNPTTQQSVDAAVDSFALGTTTGANGRCGEGANAYLRSIGAGVSVGDSMQSKLDIVNQSAETTPQKGRVMVSGVNDPKYKENGHVAIVESVNADGSYVVKEQNIKHDPKTGKGVRSERTIKANDPLVKGFYAPNVSGGGAVSKETKAYLRQATTSQSSGVKNQAVQDAYDKMVKDGESQEDIDNFLRQKVVESLPGTTKTRYENTRAASIDIDTALSTIDVLAEKGFDFAPNWADKKINDLKGIFGRATPEYNELMAAVNQGQAKARNVLFGASLTPGEASASNIFLVNPEVDTIGTIKAKFSGQKVLADVYSERLLRETSGNPMTEQEVIKKINKIREDVLGEQQPAPRTTGSYVYKGAGPTAPTQTTAAPKKYTYIDPFKN